VVKRRAFVGQKENLIVGKKGRFGFLFDLL